MDFIWCSQVRQRQCSWYCHVCGITFVSSGEPRHELIMEI